MNFSKNITLALCLLTGSMSAATDLTSLSPEQLTLLIQQMQQTQPMQPMQPQKPTESFFDKVKNVEVLNTLKNVEWMNGIDGAKKGLIKGLVMQLIQSFGSLLLTLDKDKVSNGFEGKKGLATTQVLQELVYQIDQATSNDTQGAEYVAEQLGRFVVVGINVLITNSNNKRSIINLDILKASIQRLCDSSMDDFTPDKKNIARAVLKSLLRGIASLPVINNQKPHLRLTPNGSSIALAASNTFLPLLVDGGTKLVNEKFSLVQDKNARRFAGVVKALGRITTGALLGQEYKK